MLFSIEYYKIIPNKFKALISTNLVYFARNEIRFLIMCYWKQSAKLMSISSMFYVPVFCQYFGAKKLQSQCFSFVIFGDKISYKNFAHKTLMKLTLVWREKKKKILMSTIKKSFFKTLSLRTETQMLTHALTRSHAHTHTF